MIQVLLNNVTLKRVKKRFLFIQCTFLLTSSSTTRNTLSSFIPYSSPTFFSLETKTLCRNRRNSSCTYPVNPISYNQNNSVNSKLIIHQNKEGIIVEEDQIYNVNNIATIHKVSSISCREVPILLNHIGIVKILEATADSQNDLVDMALCLDDDNDKTHSHNTKHQNSLLVGDPYGAVLWPASSAVANHLLNEFIHSSSSSSSLNSKDKLSILELGAGTGLISIAAAISGRFGHILATDYERIPLDLLEYAANHLNQGLDIHDDDDNDVLKKCERLNSIQTDLFDICNHDIPLPPADIVVAADIMYEPKTGRAMAVRAVEALRRGSRVIVGCSPGRPGRLSFHEEMKRLLPNMKIEFKDTVGQTCSGPRHELICGKGSESISAIPKELSVALMDLHFLEENESFT